MHACAGAIDRAQHPRLGGSVRQTLAGEPPLAAWSHDKREPEQGRQLLDTSLQRQDLLAKF